MKNYPSEMAIFSLVNFSRYRQQTASDKLRERSITSGRLCQRVELVI
ncbi:hypothetical protein [Chamaesiphon sp. VAR_48_metabat_403]|nr:hypothetical protein [Chamaesiphon sp. VAR_48_metabat_403]